MIKTSKQQQRMSHSHTKIKVDSLPVSIHFFVCSISVPWGSRLPWMERVHEWRLISSNQNQNFTRRNCSVNSFTKNKDFFSLVQLLVNYITRILNTHQWCQEVIGSNYSWRIVSAHQSGAVKAPVQKVVNLCKLAF